MIAYQRVRFTCGHIASRVARGGRSLVGESIRCHACGRDREVVASKPEGGAA